MPDYGPITFTIAADARSGRTSYTDDQSWQVVFGATPDEPALVLQTRYGGRVGLARLVLLLAVGDKVIYEKSAFDTGFKLRTFAPDALWLEGEPLRGLKVLCWFWVIDSHTLGAHVTLINVTGKALSVQVQIIAQAMREKKPVPMSILSLDTPQGPGVGLAMGEIGNLQPVLLQERAVETDRAKLVTPLELAQDQSQSVRFVHCGLSSVEESVLGGYKWLNEADWETRFRAIQERDVHLPFFETGDFGLDSALAWTQQTLLRSLIGGTPALPQPSPVFVRTPAFGFSPRGDGSDHGRAWAGQAGLETFHVAASLAVLDAALAAGIVRNYLAVQASDGWIDGAPGAAGQRAGYLLPPLLAQLTLIIYRYSHDLEFVKEVLPKLVKFYQRWFAPDVDVDQDGAPEWMSVHQAGWEVHPTFSTTVSRPKSADIRLAICPDLQTYLLNEGEAIKQLAKLCRDRKAWDAVKSHYHTLSLTLLWHKDRFYYIDRDADEPLFGEQLFRGRGDQAVESRLRIEDPNRLLIAVEGGVDHRPKLRVTIRGLDGGGQPISETLEDEAFEWYRSRGVAITRHFWSFIDFLRIDGLSRVYNYSLSTPDLSRYDLTLLLPYTTSVLKAKQSAAVIADLETHFWKEYGLSILPSSDPDSQTVGGYGLQVHPIWMTMLGLGLLRREERKRSEILFSSLARAQMIALLDQGSFFQWYDARTGAGVGMADHAAGTIPLHWFVQLIGVQVVNIGTVEITGRFAFQRAIKMVWHGVQVERSPKKLKIMFLSGHAVELPADAPPQLIHDPHYKPTPKPAN